MASVAELINAQGGLQRRPVTVYSPGRRVPPAPTRRTNAPAPARQQGPATRVDWNAVLERGDLQGQAEKRQQKAAEDEAWDQTPWYKKGLGMVLGNPIVSNLLVPLGAIGTAGRGVTYGLEALAESRFADQAKWLPGGVGALVRSVDTERTEEDDRSFYEKVLKPTSDYGFGQLLDPDISPWLSRPMGLAGDIMLDPTTYFTGGATRIAGAAARGAKVGEAASAVSKVDQFFDDAVRAAETGDFGKAAQASQRAAEQQAMARRLTAEAEAVPFGKRVPLRQGRKARAQFIAELTEENPELVARYSDELESAGQRGFNTIRDPALREAIGLGDPALRWMGFNIPKTEGIIYPWARAGGAVRAGLDKTPYGALGAKFAPKGLEEPLGTLTRGKGGDTLKAATAVRVQNLFRRAAGNMEGRGNKALTDLVRTWKGQSEQSVRALLREAEDSPNPNAINDFFKKMQDVYEEVAGRPMGVTRDSSTYVPHMMTAQFKRYLRSKLDDGTLDPKALEKEMGFVVDDLLEGSHYLEKSRKLTPETPGVPKDFKVAGETITLTDGTIEELNGELARAFRDFKGKAYMDDPAKIGEAYISSISRQAGRDFAMGRMAQSKNPLVHQIAGDLLEAVETRNAYLRQNPVVAKIKEGYTAGQRLVPAKPKGELPTTPFDDMFATTQHKAETQAQRDYLMKEGKQYAELVKADVSARRTTIVDTLKGLRSKLVTGLKAREGVATREINRLNKVLDKTSDEIKKLGPLSTENMDDFVGLHATLEGKVRELKGDIKKVHDRYGKKIPRAQAAIEKELDKTLAELESQIRHIEAQYDKGATAMKAEARKRKQMLEAPVYAAQEELDRAEAALRPRPVSPRRVQAANRRIRESFETEDAFEAQRQRYVDQLRHMRENNIPITRRVDGRLTPETTQAVRQAVREAEPPPAAAAEVAVPEAAPVLSREDQLREAMKRTQEARAAAPEAAVVPELAAPKAAAVSGTDTERAQQLLKTARKSVKNAEKRFQEAATALSEASTMKADPEQIRKLVYAVDTTQSRLDDAKQTLAFAEQQVERTKAAPVAAVAPEAAVEPPPIAAPTPEAPLDLSPKQQSAGEWTTADGYAIRKAGNKWRVILDEEDDMGLFPNLQAAKNEVALQQKLLSDDDIIPTSINPEPAVPEAAAVEEAVEAMPSAPAQRIEEAVEEVAPTAPEKKPGIKRLTRKWTKKTELGREIEIDDKTGWQIEPFSSSARMHVDPFGELVPAKGAPQRGTRYIAINPTEERRLMAEFAGVEKPPPLGPKSARTTGVAAADRPPMPLRGQSFGSAREAKLAVEDLLRRQRRKVTLAEYEASGRMRSEIPTFATFEELGSQIPPRAPTGTPEERAAQLAAAQAAPTLPRGRPDTRATQPSWQTEPLTPEGQELAELAPPPGGRKIVPVKEQQYWRDYDAWQAELQNSMTAGTEAERKAATARAATLGGEFTQTTGKHYQRHADETIMIEDAAWEADRNANEAWAKADAKLRKTEEDANNQVEAMVYVKHNDPTTGEEVLTRAPDTSIGFGEGEERIPVPVEVPREGAISSGPPPLPEWVPPRDPYTPEQRAADRAVLDNPDFEMIIPENRREYVSLTERSEKISHRLTTAEANQARLDQLDEAAKAAYTSEVKAADDAVRQARQAEEAARQDWHSETLIPNAHATYEAAKRRTQDAVAAQTQVRQAWMDADMAWKTAVAERDEYLKLEQNAINAEQALNNTGTNGKANVEAIMGTNPEGWDGVYTRPLPLVRQKIEGKWQMGPQPDDTQKVANKLRKALTELEAARAAGKSFVTNTDKRRLVGTMVGIDDEKRALAVNMGLEMRRAESILPRSTMEDVVITNPEHSPLVRSNFAQPPVKIPPVQGQEGLAGRAYAESFEPTMPSTRTKWGYNEEGVLQGTPEVSGRQMYEPRTEREAIAELQEEAASVKETPRTAELKRQAENVRLEQQAKEAQAAEAGIASEVKLQAEKHDALLPLRDQIETLTLVNQALHDKEKLIPLRDQAAKDLAAARGPKISKKADLVRAADEVEAVAKANPDLLDDDLATTEAVLQAAREDAKALADNDLTREQVQGQIDKVGNRKDKSLDVMLTTVGKNWRMLYEANGSKKAVLQGGDTIVDAELHRMFQNMYDMSKDKVLFGRTLNAFTNLFKTYATLTPGFHIRNALSAIFMNSSDGVALMTQLRGAGIWKEYMNAEDGEAWLKALPGRTDVHGFTGQQVHDAFAATYGTGAGGRFTEAGFAEIANEGGIMERLERLQRNRFTRWSQRVGVRVEGSVRLAMALDSMVLGENIESAIQRINRIHFDYSEISTLDENMKRLVPFWTFMSRNMPMQVSQMWTKPKLYQQYEDFVRNMGADNEEYTPEYWTKAGAFNTGFKVPDVPGLGGAQGLPIYLSPDLGFTRLKSDLKDYEEALSGKRPGGVLSQFNPFLTAPVEYLTRQDIFTGQRFEEGETVPVGGLNTPYKWLAGVLGQTEGGEVDAAFMNAIRAINPLTDRTTRLAPQLTGGDEEGRARQLESILRTVAGAPVRTLTPKQQDNEYYRRYYEELDAMRRYQERAQRQAG